MLNNSEVLNGFKTFLKNNNCKDEYIDPFLLNLNSLLNSVNEFSFVIENKDKSAQSAAEIYERLNKEHLSIKSGDRRLFNSFLNNLLRSNILKQAEDQSYFQFNNEIVKHVVSVHEEKLTADWMEEKERADSWRKSHEILEDQHISLQSQFNDLKEDLKDKDDEIMSINDLHKEEIKDLQKINREEIEQLNLKLEDLRKKNLSMTEKMLIISDNNNSKIEELTKTFTDHMLEVQKQLIELTKLAVQSQKTIYTPSSDKIEDKIQEVMVKTKRVPTVKPIDTLSEKIVKTVEKAIVEPTIYEEKEFIKEDEVETPHEEEIKNSKLVDLNSKKIDEEFQEEKSLEKEESKKEIKKRRRIKPEYKSKMTPIKMKSSFAADQLKALELWNDYIYTEEDLRTKFDNDETKVKEGLLEKFPRGNVLAIEETFEEMNKEVSRTHAKWKDGTILYTLLRHVGGEKNIGTDPVKEEFDAIENSGYKFNGLERSSVYKLESIPEPKYFDDIVDYNDKIIDSNGNPQYRVDHPRHEGTEEEYEQMKFPLYSKQFEKELKDGKLVSNEFHGPLTDMMFFDPLRNERIYSHRARDYYDEKDQFADERWNSTARRLFESNIDEHQYAYNVQADSLFFRQWGKNLNEVIRFYQKDKDGKYRYNANLNYHTFIYRMFNLLMGKTWNFDKLETIPGWAYLTEWRRREIIAFANYHKLAMEDVRINKNELRTDSASQNEALNEIIDIIRRHEEDTDEEFLLNCLNR